MTGGDLGEGLAVRKPESNCSWVFTVSMKAKFAGTLQ